MAGRICISISGCNGVIRARDGNVALTAQIDFQKCGGEFVLALGFDSSPSRRGASRAREFTRWVRRARDEYRSRLEEMAANSPARLRTGETRKTDSIITGSAPRFCTRTRRRNFPAGSSRVFRSHGDSRRATMIAAVIISPGCGISRK